MLVEHAGSDSWLVNKFISCKSRFQVDSKCVEIADGTEKREARFTSYVPAIAVRMSHKNSTGVAARQRHWDKRRKKTFKKGVTKTKKEDGEIRSLQEAWDKADASSFGDFDNAPLSSATKKGLRECGYKESKEIQRESLPYALQGRDVLGKAKTGSGKTLAFIIPLLERLFTLKWSRPDGLGALVITPTRELARQIFDQLAGPTSVGKYHDFSAGLVIGGTNLSRESDLMRECNIVICTPGRLLQHMEENPLFDVSSLRVLVLDEADRCLDMGFARQMNAILSELPTEERQTLLFSATQTTSVDDLARCSLKRPVYVSVHEHASKATPDELVEHYMVCQLHQKLDILWSFIKAHRKNKILVFAQSCKQVKYYTDLFRRLRVPTVMTALYGSLNQLRRMAIYKDFCEAGSGVLMATDLAARGLDFPTVDWVFQLDCPEDATVYNHRVGRTARNGAKGQALVLLMPSEEETMLKLLKSRKFPVERIEANPQKVMSIQRKIQAQLAGDHELKEEAQRAFQSYLKSVFLMKNKLVFDVTKLDTESFAASLGLAVAPRVRFIQKRLKAEQKEVANKQSKAGVADSEVESPAAKPTFMQALGDSDGDDDDILTVKRIDHKLSDNEDSEGPVDPLSSRKAKSSQKVVTKAALAKKLLKKNIQANQKLKFDDEGEVVEDSSAHKMSTEGRQYEKEDASGIDLEKAKTVLRAEDQFDRKKERERVRKMHKEKRRKAREARNKRGKDQDENSATESSEEEEPDLGWLPDPDKVYGEEVTCEESSPASDEEGATQQSSKKRKWKPPKKEKKLKAGKKAKVVQEDDEYDEDDLLQLHDDETLALHLLKQ